MKSVMYHYIRNFDKKYPYYNKLSVNQFISQIKKFQKYGIVNNSKELFIPSNKIILTFDDGVKDHLNAAEILKKNDAIGIFFIPTKPYLDNKILDVHKTHLLTGRVKGDEILEKLKKYLIKNNIKNFFDMTEKKKFKEVYKKDNDNENKKEFKKIMNYYGNLNMKEKILNFLLKTFDINFETKNFYLTKKEIKYISSLGMLIGSHGESHTLLSRMKIGKQKKEIENSKKYLTNIVKSKIEFFCYPYGGKKSYNSHTLNILKKLKFKQAYIVKNKDISKNDLLKKNLELPRYDCNLF